MGKPNGYHRQWYTPCSKLFTSFTIYRSIDPLRKRVNPIENWLLRPASPNVIKKLVEDQ